MTLGYLYFFSALAKGRNGAQHWGRGLLHDWCTANSRDFFLRASIHAHDCMGLTGGRASPRAATLPLLVLLPAHGLFRSNAAMRPQTTGNFHFHHRFNGLRCCPPLNGPGLVFQIIFTDPSSLLLLLFFSFSFSIIRRFTNTRVQRVRAGKRGEFSIKGICILMEPWRVGRGV